ncbi:beta-soluble NSF attachment protein-like [Argiope bruennichi]|uniref:Alpha-soluble NSF attachment protein like n=1 Tax=Argiope bruennichi TaxID=94029 RepID=A0A8T0F9Y6_ARGBR|nr:beta-soluble NSF attachment protein-like [Argiope bruennichi]KAF8787996.1 Alpha-soluble NSF attachment protein like [Argiope bruennichi]
MGDQQRSKGEQLMIEAEAMLNQGGGMCCGKKARVRSEEACMLYVKAANAFKMAKEWHKAGNAFAEAATIELKNERKTEAAMHFVEAAKCYKKVSPNECEQCLVKAGEVYDDVGRGKTAAKQLMTLAELYEEQGNLQRAVEEYQKAADMFTTEQLASSTTKCLIKIATHSASLGDYDRARKLFEEIGTEALNNSLLKYTANENYTKAGLCILANNPQDGKGLQEKIEEWKDTNPSFPGSRECNFLSKLALAVIKDDVDEFNEAIRSHESISRLSDWDNALLKTIRKNLGPDLR